jgi:hypothetical protein
MSFIAREARRKKQTQRQKNLFTYSVTILKTLLTQFCHCFLTTIHNYLQFLCSAKYYSFCFPSLKSLWQYRSWSFNLGISTTRYTTLGGFSKKLRETIQGRKLYEEMRYWLFWNVIRFAEKSKFYNLSSLVITAFQQM